ncbi:MAG: hypothetical protein JRH08_15260 [Deltaproteobacteria bacterium]|nr:hypothetical protein [Deltaproteobacteria bacterium]MBW1931348.1 hypothetical protein [Deltaproteobacteria bacterium]MBW2027007.1 hypothetical protein [Deltaproteobacteria bacterium]MBW2126989.1 hypothetical protein [Deltaproteobacteria bacterium]
MPFAVEALEVFHGGTEPTTDPDFRIKALRIAGKEGLLGAAAVIDPAALF